MTPRPGVLERPVVKALAEVARRWKDSYPTHATRKRHVIDALGKLGRSLGYEVYTKLENSRWSYDVSWAERRDGCLFAVPLVLQCGWDFEETLFETLLLAKASLRVLVHHARGDEEAQEAISSLIDAAGPSRLAKRGDRYMFACWAEDIDDFVVQLYTVP